MQEQMKRDSHKSVANTQISQKYVKDSVKKFDWVTYIIGLYIPGKIRNDFYTIQWLNKELYRISSATREISLAKGKLDFWKDNIEKIYKGQLVKEPVTVSLSEALKQTNLPKVFFHRIIDAHISEAESHECLDIVEMEQRAEKIRTTLILLNMKLLRIDLKNNPVCFEVAELMGRALGILDYIRSLPVDLANYKLFMPKDICEKHCVNLTNLWERTHGKPKDELGDVVLETAAHARELLRRAQAMSGDLPKQSHRALLHGVEAQYFLENLENANFDIFDKTLHQQSWIQLPLRIRKAAANGRYWNTLIKEE